jgi:hypothetical protein
MGMGNGVRALDDAQNKSVRPDRPLIISAVSTSLRVISRVA